MTRKIRNKKRHEEILRAASDLFRKKGYNHVTMDDIANEIGTSKLSIYYHFESKEDLLQTISDDTYKRLMSGFKKAIDSGTSNKEKLILIIINHITTLTSAFSPETIALKQPLYISGANRKRSIKKRDLYDKEIRKIIKDGIKQKEFIECDAKLAYFAIIGAANSVINWYSKEGPLSLEEIADFFAKFLIRTLLIDVNI